MDVSPLSTGARLHVLPTRQPLHWEFSPSFHRLAVKEEKDETSLSGIMSVREDRVLCLNFLVFLIAVHIFFSLLRGFIELPCAINIKLKLKVFGFQPHNSAFLGGLNSIFHFAVL